MKIVLIGYGKMGRAIEEIAVERGHSIVLKIDESNQDEFTAAKLKEGEVAIEFTGPHTAEINIRKTIEFGLPIISGSTGWTENLNGVIELVNQKQGAFIYASNFSVGVNIFFEINKKLASFMANHKDYAVTIEEIHHTQKKDAPSGTAISIAEQIIEEMPSKKQWVNHPTSKDHELQILSIREDPAPGTHHVKYSSPIDDIEIIHTAHNRQGFALGAVLAAEFIVGKKGIFSMKDVLDL